MSETETETEIIHLKAEVFDLIAERDRVQNEINKRLLALEELKMKKEAK